MLTSVNENLLLFQDEVPNKPITLGIQGIHGADTLRVPPEVTVSHDLDALYAISREIPFRGNPLFYGYNFMNNVIQKRIGILRSETELHKICNTYQHRPICGHWPFQSNELELHFSFLLVINNMLFILYL